MIPLCKTSGEKLLRQSHIYNSVKHQRRSSSAKTANELNTLTASSKEFHRRPPFVFQVQVRLEVL